MKAMRYHEFGGPEFIQQDDVPLPRPAEGEVLIDVHASSINPADWMIGAGLLRGVVDYALPFIPGFDFSGVVTALGPGVTGFDVGDRVFGARELQAIGTYAESIAVAAFIVAQAPRSIPLMTAGAVPLAALTAWFATLAPDHADVRAGQSVLIHGGAGGTGTFAIQFARWRGAQVFATASAPNLEFLRSLGVHEAIDYRTQRFEDVAGEVDAVIDLVGGDVQARSFPLIRAGGVLTSIVAAPDQQLAKRRGVRATMIAAGPPRDPEVLKEVARLIDDGTIRVVVSDTVTLSDAGKALAKSREGHVRGKIVLTIRDAELRREHDHAT